jgi:hypothetical protein
MAVNQDYAKTPVEVDGVTKDWEGRGRKVEVRGRGYRRMISIVSSLEIVSARQIAVVVSAFCADGMDVGSMKG